MELSDLSTDSEHDEELPEVLTTIPFEIAWKTSHITSGGFRSPAVHVNDRPFVAMGYMI